MLIFTSCPECGAAFGDPHWPGCAHTPDRPSALDDALQRRGFAVIDGSGEAGVRDRPEELRLRVVVDRPHTP